MVEWNPDWEEHVVGIQRKAMSIDKKRKRKLGFNSGGSGNDPFKYDVLQYKHSGRSIGHNPVLAYRPANIFDSKTAHPVNK